MVPHRISFAGAGKVANALCMELHSKGHAIELIVSPTKERGAELADACKARWSSETVFPDTTDLVIVAVPDHSLQSVLSGIECGANTIVAHTAGSYGLDIFPYKINRHGVFYPLQTFTAGRKTDFKDVPVFIEASDGSAGKILESIAESLGSAVYRADAEKRRLLHVAAVFVSNFTNYMLTSGKEIAGRAGFDFEVLRPLVIETVSKALEIGPGKSQTGPALRYDLNTIEKHMDLLSFSPEYQDLYSEISKAIMNYYKYYSRNE